MRLKKKMMNNNNITESSLIISLARLFKKKKKLANVASKLLVDIVYYQDGNNMVVMFDDEKYTSSNNIVVIDCVNSALYQSGCDGICYPANKNTISVVLYGKPVEEFIKLSRLVYKNTGIMMNRNDISIEYSSLPSYYNDYLCYSQTPCLRAINFIKANKKRNKLEIDFCELKTETLKKKFAIMKVKTNSGKVKAKQYLYF